MANKDIVPWDFTTPQRSSKPPAIRLLLVDDDEDDYVLMLDMVSHMRLAHYTLDWVTNMDDAKLALSGDDYDLYLVDYFLGATTGIELLDYATDIGSKAPIILLTGVSSEEIDLQALKAGATDFLVKSELFPNLLERTIRYAMEHKKTLETLREAQERFTLAVNGSNDGIWDWDLVTNTIYFSPRWKTMLGLPETDDTVATPQAWFERVHPDHQEMVRQMLRDHLQGHTTLLNIEYLIRHEDGSYRWMQCRGMAVRLKTKTATRLAGSQTDITDKKESESQRETFVATLTHDLKTPIRSEARVLELLMQNAFGELSPPQHEVLANLLQSNRFMHHMVDNLLTTYKYEDGRLTLSLERTQLNTLIEQQVHNELKTLADEKSITLKLSLAPDLPDLMVDPVEVQRIINNLGHNAITNTPAEGIITMKTEFTDSDVTLIVQDTGRGIAPELLPDLFQRYNAGAKRMRQVGTGLGLYLSKQLVELHGGHITVFSEPGQGSQFHITFPRSDGDPSGPS